MADPITVPADEEEDKGFLGGVGKFISKNSGMVFGIIGGLLGMLMGGIGSMGGILMTLAMGALAAFAGPSIMNYFGLGGEDKTPAPDAGLPRAPGGPSTSRAPQVGKLETSIESPSFDESSKKWTSKLLIDGKEHELELQFKSGTNQLLVEKVYIDGFISSAVNPPIKIGALDKEGKPVLDEAGMNKLAQKVGKDFRTASLVAIKPSVSTLEEIDANTYMAKTATTAYTIVTNDTGLEVKNLLGETLHSVTLDHPEALANKSALARIAGEAVIEADRLSVGSTSLSTTAFPLASTPAHVSLTPGVSVAEKGPAKEGEFLINGQPAQYSLETAYNEKDGKYSVTGVTITDANGKVLETYTPRKPPVIGQLQMDSAESKYIPDDAALTTALTGALAEQDKRIEGLKDKVYYIGGGISTPANQRNYLLEGSNGTYVITTTEESPGTYTTRISDTAGNVKTEVEGSFTSSTNAIKAGLHAIVDGGESGAKGPVKKKEDILRLADNGVGGSPVEVADGTLLARPFSPTGGMKQPGRGAAFPTA